MNGNFKLIFSILLLCISTLVKAEPLTYQQAVVKLNTLLADKDYQQAFALADELTYEHGGLPEFDLLSGFAAYGLGRYQEAVFAFERVLAEKPDSYIARFYLARTYKKLNNLAAAIKESESLLESNLPEQQRELVQDFKSSLELEVNDRARSWGHSIAVGLVVDSNVNSGTDEGSTYFRNPQQQDQVIQVALTESSRERRDTGYHVNYQAYYNHILNQNQKFKASIALGHHDYMEFSEYQRNPLNFDLTFTQSWAIGDVSLSAYTRPLLIEEQDYRTETGTNLSWKHSVTRSARVSANVSYAKVTKDQFHDLGPELNQDFKRTRLSASYMFSDSLVHGISTHWYQDVSDNASYRYNDKDVFGAMYQLSWPIDNTLLLSSYLLIEKHEYQATHPWATNADNDNISRDDTMTTLSSQLRFDMSEQVDLKLHLTLQNKSSNLPLYSFNRTEMGLTWLYKL